jgi:cephalosporin hydroxylase
LPPTVALEDLSFEKPFELVTLARRHERDLIDAAASHGLALGDADAIAAANDAVSSGALRSASVVIPGQAAPLTVVDAATFVDEMQAYFSSAPGFRPAAPATRPSQWRGRLHRWAWTPPARWVIERLWRAPASVCGYAWVGPMAPFQIRAEIVQLLELMRERRPEAVLEIGTADGGTTYLLSRFTARRGIVVTCDLAPRVQPGQLRAGAQRRQSVDVLALDSHQAAGCRQLHERLPRGVDVLFIDGDHRYEGARQDLCDYADLLRPGGALVFHDIVDDYRTRYGIATWAWVGGVPRLWRELRAALPAGFEAREFIADRAQDGLGIGVVICPDIPAPGAVLLAGLDL